MDYLFANKASSLLASGISDSDTSLSVESGHGAKFPTPGAGEAFRCVIFNAAGAYEIIEVTAVSGDSFTTIARAQEGTTAQSWSAGDAISLRMTAGLFAYWDGKFASYLNSDAAFTTDGEIVVADGGTDRKAAGSGVVLADLATQADLADKADLTYVDTELADKADLDSPNFTGAPTIDGDDIARLADLPQEQLLRIDQIFVRDSMYGVLTDDNRLFLSYGESPPNLPANQLGHPGIPRHQVNLPGGALPASLEIAEAGTYYPNALYVRDLDDDLWVSGNNLAGQLGIGNTTSITQWVNVPPPSGTGITKVRASSTPVATEYATHAVLLCNDGSAWAAGNNAYGQLGQGDTTFRSSWTEIPKIGGNSWLDVVCFGGVYGCTLLRNTNGWYAAGYNIYGQLGVGDNSNKTTMTAVQTVSSSAVPTVPLNFQNNVSHVIWNDGGTCYGTGYNGYGQLGLNDQANRNTPVAISGVTGVTKVWVFELWGTTFFQQSNGAIYACGWNNSGGLGVGSASQVITSPTLCGSYSVVDIVRAGGNHEYHNHYMLLSDGTVKSAGYNTNYGALIGWNASASTLWRDCLINRGHNWNTFKPLWIKGTGIKSAASPAHYARGVELISLNGDIHAGGDKNFTGVFAPLYATSISAVYSAVAWSQSNYLHSKAVQINYHGQIGIDYR